MTDDQKDGKDDDQELAGLLGIDGSAERAIRLQWELQVLPCDRCRRILETARLGDGTHICAECFYR